MERKQFYKKIDQLAEHWYVDANRPPKGVGYVRKDGSKGPRRKTNIRGEENPINESSGEVQIVKWAKKSEFCVQCSKPCQGKVEEINLKKGQIKCSCGLKYPIVNISTIS
jgi:hypothetical protein